MTLLSLLHPLISPDYVSWPKVFPSCWSSLVFTLLKVMLIIALFFLTEPLLTSMGAQSFISVHMESSVELKYTTVRPQDTRPQAARTSQVHVFELGPKKFEMNEFM